MREALIARHLCNLQPFPVRLRILRNKAFGEKFGLTTQIVMNVANFGPIDQRDFIITVRKAFIKDKAQQFKCLDGTKILIAPQQDGVLLKKYPGGKASRKILLREPLILSPDPDKRNIELNEMLNRMGPTAPDFSTLQTASVHRELCDAEVTELLTESATGLTAFKESLIRALKIHGVTLDHIVPDSLDCRVGGGAPQGWPPSAAQTQHAVFPHWAFTKAAYPAGAMDGISDIRFTRPISPYKIVLGSFFHPVLRQRLCLCDHIRRTIHRSKRLKSLRTWALQ